MYYLKSRYYDPGIRRFVCADGLFYEDNILGNNLYAYCFNNPIIYMDTDGRCPYNGTAADFHRLEAGLPSLDYTCSVEIAASKAKPNMRPNPNKRKGSENRQKSGSRQRNVGHPNGEEHSRVPKGNGIRKSETMSALAVTTLTIVYLVANDFTGIGVADNAALAPISAIWWDYASVWFV